MPQYVMIKDKIKIGPINPQNALDKIESTFSDINHDKTDGLKLIWNNKWAHIRKSNTEPIIRIYAEAPTDVEVQSMVKNIKSIIYNIKGF